MALQQYQNVKRIIHYYNLLVGEEIGFQYTDKTQPFFDVFKAIETEIQSNGESRYVVSNDKTFIIPEINIRSDTGFIQGKLFAIRAEDFPEVHDLTTSKTRDFEVAESEGLVETSYFVINHKKLHPTIGFEYNQYGAKIQDLCRYLTTIGLKYKTTTGVAYQHVVKDELRTFIERMGNYSKMVVRIHRNNVERLNNVDPGLATMFSETFDQFEGEYATIEIKFDYKNGAPKAGNKVGGLIKNLLKNRQNNGIFDVLYVTAQDSEMNNKLHAFDLLVDKVKSEIIVQKRGKSRTIVSTDILYQMNSELLRLNL